MVSTVRVRLFSYLDRDEKEGGVRADAENEFLSRGREGGFCS